MASISYRREKDLRKAVEFSPAEEADNLRVESQPWVQDQLDNQLNMTKDPRARAILMAENTDRKKPKREIIKVDPSLVDLTPPPAQPSAAPKGYNALEDATGEIPIPFTSRTMHTPFNNLGNRAMIGIGQGLGSAQRGTQESVMTALDLIGSQMPNTEFGRWTAKRKQDIANLIAEHKRLDAPIAADDDASAGAMIGQNMPTALVPGSTAAKTTMGAISKGAGMGLINAISGERGEMDPAAFWAINGGLGGVVNAGFHTGNRLVNAVRGKFRDISMPGNQATPVEAYESSKRAGIPTSIGDIDPTSKWHAWENFMERLPFSGRAKFLKEQAGKTTDAMNKAKADLTAPEVAQGEDPAKALFNAVQGEYKTRKADVDQAFNRVEAAAQHQGVDYVHPAETFAATQQIKADFGNTLFDRFADPRLKKAVGHIEEVFDPTNAAQQGPVPFADMRKLRTLVGEKVRQSEKMVRAGSISDGEHAGMVHLYDSINRDLDNWGSGGAANQNVMDLFKEASDAYKSKIDPYKRVPILNEVRLAAPDAPFDYDRLLAMATAKDRPAKAALVLDQAGDSGRQIVAGHVVSNAADRGMNPNRAGSLSTKNFLDSLDLGRTRGEVFDPATAARVGDLETGVRAARRADRYITEPPTNSRLTPQAIAGAATGLGGAGLTAMFGPIGGLGAALGVGGSLAATRLSNAYTSSNAGKRMYLADPEAITAHAKELQKLLPLSWEDYFAQQYGE